MVAKQIEMHACITLKNYFNYVFRGRPITTIRICFIGDSLTNATGDREFHGWTRRLASYETQLGHNITAYDLGVRADTSNLISKRWRSESRVRLTKEYNCGLVFSFGTNDMAMEDGILRVSLEDSINNAKKILSEANAWLPTLWIGPPPVNDHNMPFASLPGRERFFSSTRIGALNVSYKYLAQTLNIPYLDVFTPLSANPEWLSSFHKDDGVHPTKHGYHLLAKIINIWPAWRSWFDDQKKSL